MSRAGPSKGTRLCTQGEGKGQISGGFQGLEISSVTQPATCLMGTGGSAKRLERLITHLLVVQSLRIRGSLPPLHLPSSRKTQGELHVTQLVLSPMQRVVGFRMPLYYTRRWLGSGCGVVQHRETHLRLCKCMEPDAITTHIHFFTARPLQ